MSDFLADTLIWTGALLVLVLIARRPVASQFGAHAAYALWALPMARLLLPPIVLPAWMAPAAGDRTDAAVATATEFAMTAQVETASLAHPVASGTDAGGVLASLTGLASIDWQTVAIAVWLAGAAIFLVRRYALYFRMRADLLEEARPVGEAGSIRLVETPAADGPVAFGVVDKVVALPIGFMAGHDRTARDLALAHELAHHRGHDLLCNMLVQPLFALHWFNPLSTLGWRALRRDQEAACDARVVANSPRESRAAYAAVIARFATQPRHTARLALAAPMACPVLGDRSIVQRLKSLAMTDISARRRWSGRLLIAAAAVTLPLTGSLSYAQDEIASDTIEPPVPPAPLASPNAPAAPRTPEAPSAVVGEDGARQVVRIERRVVREDGADTRVERRVIRRTDDSMTAEDRAELAREMADLRKELDRELGEHSEFQRELRRKLGENGEMQREIRMAVAEAGRARAQAHTQAAAAMATAPRVTMQCRNGQREVAETVTMNGREHVFVCNSLAMGEARRALAEARAEIARTRELTQQQRTQALRSIDEAERAVRAD